MAVNVGAAASQLFTPWVKNHVNEVYGHGYGWHAAFAVCCFGLLLGLTNYLVMRNAMQHIGSEPDRHPADPMKVALVAFGGLVAVAVSAAILQYETLAEAFVLLAGLAVLAIFWILIKRGDRQERAGLLAALILVIQTVFFFIFYQQMSSSLALFALRNVDWNFAILGTHLWTWSPGQFQALNPLWIMVLSPILAWLYTRAGQHGRDLHIAAKFALGFVFVAIGFFTYSSAAWLAVDGKVNSWIMVWGYGFSSLGELLVSGLGLAMIRAMCRRA